MLDKDFWTCGVWGENHSPQDQNCEPQISTYFITLSLFLSVKLSLERDNGEMWKMKKRKTLLCISHGLSLCSLLIFTITTTQAIFIHQQQQ